MQNKVSEKVIRSPEEAAGKDFCGHRLTDVDNWASSPLKKVKSLLKTLLQTSRIQSQTQTHTYKYLLACQSDHIWTPHLMIRFNGVWICSFGHFVFILENVKFMFLSCWVTAQRVIY